jgi:hypothetical protein
MDGGNGDCRGSGEPSGDGVIVVRCSGILDGEGVAVLSMELLDSGRTLSSEPPLSGAYPR